MVGPVVMAGQHDDVAQVWLTRPRHANALDPESVQRLHDELSAAEARPKCMALVIRAEGSTFCAGADVRASAKLMETPAALLEFFDEGRRLMERLVNSRIISIAVVQGLAAAGGLELVAATDLVVATKDAVFADRHAAFGFLPAFGATSLLPLRIGRNKAANMLLGGCELDASAAHESGLVHRTCAATEVDDVIDQEVERLRSFGADTLSALKTLINQTAPISLDFEKDAVRRFSEEGGYDPSRFIARAERARGLKR